MESTALLARWRQWLLITSLKSGGCSRTAHIFLPATHTEAWLVSRSRSSLSVRASASDSLVWWTRYAMGLLKNGRRLKNDLVAISMTSSLNCDGYAMWYQ